MLLHSVNLVSTQRISHANIRMVNHKVLEDAETNTLLEGTPSFHLCNRTQQECVVCSADQAVYFHDSLVTWHLDITIVTSRMEYSSVKLELPIGPRLSSNYQQCGSNTKGSEG